MHADNGPDQRDNSAAIRQIHICPGFNKHFDHIKVPAVTCVKERAIFILIVCSIHIRPGGNHKAGGIDIIVLNRLVKGFLDIGIHFYLY